MVLQHFLGKEKILGSNPAWAPTRAILWLVGLKDDVRRLIVAAREKEARDLVPHVDDSAPAEPGRWTAKDNLAHLASWRLTAAAELEAVRTGGPAPAVTEETEAHNARVYEAERNEPAKAVIEGASRAWDSLFAAVEACSEADLLKPRVRRPEQPVWQVVPGNTYFHVAQHLDYWHTERGEDEAAEDAARWAHQLACDVFPADRSRGFADYNLGCFYAVRGRAEEAIPYLRRGLALNPVLLDWARKDGDLDPIRSAPAFASLLDGPA
jgi:tetratricopeptide (TPR) repeat protein